MGWMTRRRARADYINRVVALLADEFEWDESTRYICRSNLQLADYDNGFPPWFEFICDHPSSALWRLKTNPNVGRWGLRMSFYGLNPPSDEHAKQITQRLVAALDGDH